MSATRILFLPCCPLAGVADDICVLLRRLRASTRVLTGVYTSAAPRVARRGVVAEATITGKCSDCFRLTLAKPRDLGFEAGNPSGSQHWEHRDPRLGAC